MPDLDNRRPLKVRDTGWAKDVAARLAKALGLKVWALTRGEVGRRPLAFRVEGTGDPDGILPDRQAASDTWHLLRYFRLSAQGRLVMGSRGFFGNAPVANDYD